MDRVKNGPIWTSSTNSVYTRYANFLHLGALGLRSERQSTWISKIKKMYIR